MSFGGCGGGGSGGGGSGGGVGGCGGAADRILVELVSPCVGRPSERNTRIEATPGVWYGVVG